MDKFSPVSNKKANNFKLKSLSTFLIFCLFLSCLCGCTDKEVYETSEYIVVSNYSTTTANTSSVSSNSQSSATESSKTSNSSAANSSIVSCTANSDNSNTPKPIKIKKGEENRYMPTSVTVTFYDCQNSLYGFTFNTLEKPINPVIEIKKQTEKNWQRFTLTTVQDTIRKNNSKTQFYYISKTNIKLDSNSTYVYRACDIGAITAQGKAISTANSTLKTPNTKSKSFSFVHVSDTQAGPEYFAQVLAAVAGKTNFLLHTGDVINDAYYEEWVKMIDENHKYVSRVPMMVVSGNHDCKGTNQIFNHFNYKLPSQTSASQGFFYSYIYGDVKFIMLNTNDLTGNQLKPQQYNWLVNELKTNKCKWTIVSLHHPLYSPGTHGSLENTLALSLQEQLNGIFAQYGVDLVLQGHDHVVSRTFPIDKNGKVQKDTNKTISGTSYVVNPKGVIYTMDGTSGVQSRDVSIIDNKLYAYSSGSKKATWAEYNIDGDKLTVTVKYIENGKEQIYYKWGIKKN